MSDIGSQRYNSSAMFDGNSFFLLIAINANLEIVEEFVHGVRFIN